MNKQEFQTFLEGGMVLLDGATGSNLQKRGMPSGICVEQWVCEHEEELISLQKEYMDAGSNVIYAPTFAANQIKLREFGLEDQTKELNRRLTAISRKAAQGRAKVAGDVTMTGQQLEPLGSLKLEELIDVYKEQMKALEEAGADFLVVETMMSLQETRAALIAAAEEVELPVLVTMSFGGDGRTLYGTDAKTAAVVLEGLGAAAIGVNCSAGPDKMLPVIRAMRETASVPVAAKPNAGMPKLGKEGETEYDMDVEEFAMHMEALAKAGAVMLGGCCGTDPEYIRRLKEVSAHWMPAEAQKGEDKVYLASERQTLEWTKECHIGMISSLEDEELAEEWADGIYDAMYDQMDDLEDEGADLLCICVDGTKGDPEDIIRQVVKEAAGYTTVPIVFRSENPKVLELALRHYPGRSGIMSTNPEDEALQKMAKKYGAAVLSQE